MNINLKKLNYYIAGMFDGEGNFDKVTINISNTNLFLLKIIHKHLLSLSIINTIKKRKNKLKSYYLDAYDIKIFGRNNISNFYTYIPFFHKQKRHKMLKYLVQTKSCISFKELKQMKNDKLKGLTFRAIAKKWNKSLGMVYDYIIKNRKPNH
jgi:hypothetical protein